MGKEIYKVGQLVYASNDAFTYKELVSGDVVKGYGIILDIVDINTKESFQEKEIITGWGDKNTKVNIIIKFIAKERDLWNINEFIEYVKNPSIIEYNPHCVTKISLKNFEKKYKDGIQNMNRKLEFIRKYSVTRDEKLDIIIESI